MAKRKDWKKRTQLRDKEDIKELIYRLSKVEGTVRGIKGMVEKGAYFSDILVQISSCNAALHAFNKELIAMHIKDNILTEQTDEKIEKVDELVKELKRLMK